MSLEGKTAIVTGAAQGIGRAIAECLAQAGADIAVADLDPGRSVETVASVEKLGRRALNLKVNVADTNDTKTMVEQVLKTWGKVDILVNNAGVYEWSPIESFTEDQFHKHFDINVLGLLLASQEAVNHFGSNGGNIINISSTVTSLTPPNGVVYTATKGAVDAITRTLAKELGARKIRVNAINPGLIETEGVVSGGFTEGDFRKAIEAQTPLGRIGQPDDIAPAAVFLASDDSKYLTGETIRIAGGLR